MDKYINSSLTQCQLLLLENVNRIIVFYFENKDKFVSKSETVTTWGHGGSDDSKEDSAPNKGMKTIRLMKICKTTWQYNLRSRLQYDYFDFYHFRRFQSVFLLLLFFFISPQHNRHHSQVENFKMLCISFIFFRIYNNGNHCQEWLLTRVNALKLPRRIKGQWFSKEWHPRLPTRKIEWNNVHVWIRYASQG